MATKDCIIHVYLINEGTDSWRPVPSQRVSDDIYILGDVEGVRSPDDEVWEFEPGTRVKVAEKRFYDGEIGLVAIARA